MKMKIPKLYNFCFLTQSNYFFRTMKCFVNVQHFLKTYCKELDSDPFLPIYFDDSFGTGEKEVFLFFCNLKAIMFFFTIHKLCLHVADS